MLSLFGLLILFHSSLGSALNENEAMMALEMSSFANVYKSFETPCELLKFRALRGNASWGIVGIELDGRPQLYVTFRGTSKIEEIKLDLNFKAVENDDLGAYVHNGMSSIFTDFKMHEFILVGLYEKWRKMTTEFKSDIQLIVTGHSLGGGLAQIFAAYISRRFDFEILSKEEHYLEFLEFLHNSRTYTFGSPQVFRLYESLVPRWVEKVEQSSVHFVNENDIVPLLNLLRERSIVNIAEATKSKITENSPGSGVWQDLKAKEWKKFICGLGSAAWTLGSNLSSCVLNELCFDSSYKQWGTILYYTDEAQFYTRIDLNERTNGSLLKAQQRSTTLNSVLHYISQMKDGLTLKLFQNFKDSASKSRIQ